MIGAEILRREGEARGKADVLLLLLAKRFGALSPATEQRIRAASMDELDRWTDRILTVHSLDELGL
ncbi:hypothetical protein BH09MYX1_BH09MYX1_02270 [soil metagenome]